MRSDVPESTPPLNKRMEPWAARLSDAFGLRQARSVQAEEAIEAAERFLRGDGAGNPPGLQTRDEIDLRLRDSLGDRDPFWPRWLVRTGQV